jgi:hypothetical protein
MPKFVVTAQLELDVDSEIEAELTAGAALENMVGGSVVSAWVTDVNQGERA